LDSMGNHSEALLKWLVAAGLGQGRRDRLTRFSGAMCKG
jgi:hypothetical protein